MKQSKKRNRMQRAVVGVAWYRREEYEQLKAMFPDGSQLHDTFDGWLESAQNLVRVLTGEGHVVEKALIDPVAFPAWCSAHGKGMDAKGRTAYATECAAKRRGVAIK